MTTAKKFLSIILTILMLVTMIPFTPVAFAADILDSGFCGNKGDNVTWTLDSNGVLTISGTGAMNDYKAETPVLPYAPYFIDSRIKTVVIEEGVTRIGECAFHQCEYFTSITIPDSVTSIGKNAFTNSYSLTSVSVPCTWGSGNMTYNFLNNVKVTVREHSLSAGICTVCQYECEHSFEGDTCMLCGIKTGNCGYNVTWRLGPEGLLIISGEGDIYDYEPSTSPFYRNEEIKTVIIEDGVTSIGYDTFFECENLESVTIGNSVATIRYSAFMSPRISSVSVPCTWDSENPMYYFDEEFVEVTLREHSFEDGTCTVCGVTCKALGHVIKNGTCIGCGRVGTCGAEGDNLTWTLDNDGLLTISGTGDMANYFFKSDTNIKTVVIEDGVTSIGIEAFAYCNNLESITIPDSVKSIGWSAFKLCTSLKSITIPDSVKSIGKNMFYNCTSLESVTIGNGATNIEQTTFYLCTSLKSITIGNGMTTIDKDAFTSCPSLTYVHYLGTSSQWDKIDIYYFFDNNIKLQNATRHYCTEVAATVTCTEDGYTAGWYCADCGEYVVGGEETTAPGHNFVGGTCTGCNGTCATLGHIIENGICIGCGKVGYCGAEGDNLIWTLDNDGLLTISGTGAMAKSCFMYNANIKTVVIEDGVTSIGNNAFYYCEMLNNITIPNSVTSIGIEAFERCSRLTNLTIPDSVKTIGSYAFYDCYNLRNITIGNNVTSIGSYAFEECDYLSSVSIPCTWNQKSLYKFGPSVRVTVRDHKVPETFDCTEGYTCTVCGQTVAAVDSHTAPATFDCTKGYTCTVCAQPVAAADNHTGGTANCKEQAKCTVCGKSYGELNADNHKNAVTDKAVTATCTQTGLTEGSHCDACGKVIAEQTVTDMLAHSGGTANCKEQAQCTVCGEPYGELNADNHKNAVTDAAVAATCTKTGLTEGSHCEACGKVIAEQTVTDMLAHSGGTANCKEQAKCTSCGAPYGELNADNHKNAVTDEAVAASCTQTGLTEGSHCDACGKVIAEQTKTDMLAHKDDNGDYKCDYGCGHEFEKPVDPTPDTPTDNCDHLCHQSGFVGFIWKIVNFLQRLFGIQQYCDCGVLHYDKPVFG